MIETFGARLRQRREKQGIDLLAIAERTKIKQSLLEALERDDVSHWPSGIYRRAYIRSYAQAIGLDPDQLAREFLEAYPEPVDVAALEEIASLADGARTNGGPPTRLRYIVGSALGSLARLRRTPAAERVENLVVADAGFVDMSSPAEPEAPAAADSSSERAWVEAPNELIAPSCPAVEPPSFEPDLLSVADLCTGFARVGNTSELQGLLAEAAGILDASGLIVWIWDASADGLNPALAHGYSERVLAQLPTVSRDADNATAAAFRSAEMCAIAGSEDASAALVVPLLTPDGCAGVLAIELPEGREQVVSVGAVAKIFAALLAQLLGRSDRADAPHAETTAAPPADDFTPPLLRASLRQ